MGFYFTSSSWLFLHVCCQ